MDSHVHIYLCLCLFSIAGIVVIPFMFRDWRSWLSDEDLLVEGHNQENEETKLGLTFQCSDAELGNRMFYYAVVYGIARLNYRKGFLQRCNTITCRSNEKNCARTSLDQIFNLSLPIQPDISQEQKKGYGIRFHLQFPSSHKVPKDVNVLTGEPYPVSVTHFLHVQDEIRREFRFKEELRVSADRILQQAKGSRNSSTLIGVHVRRGSYLEHLKTFKCVEASPKFFQFGLQYFRLKYGDAVFVVVSDDLPWCRANILGKDVFIPEAMGSPELDLAVLSGCQHTLFDYGTYGFWGAFLAGGETMYFVDGIVDPTLGYSDLRKVMYPPEWTGVSNDMIEAMSNSCFNST